MSAIEERIRQFCGVSVESMMASTEALLPTIIKAARRLTECLLQDRKILICGNGASAANASHFTTAMLHHFDVERPSLPVITLTSEASTLTAIASHQHYDNIFARQIHAFGQAGDVLLVLTATGNANNLLQAVNAANDRGMDTVALTGRNGGLLSNHLGPEDIELRVGADHVPRVREMHLFILHCFCDLIDQFLFGQLAD